MKKYIFLFFVFYSCVTKKVITTNDTTKDSITTSADTNTQLKSTIDSLPPVTIHDTINFDSFCDSLLKGFNPVVISPSTKIIVHTNNHKSIIECKTDSLVRVTNDLTTIIKNNKNIIHEHEKIVYRDVTRKSFMDYVYQIGFYIGWLLLLIVLIRTTYK